jgi:hypothetical protein
MQHLFLMLLGWLVLVVGLGQDALGGERMIGSSGFLEKDGKPIFVVGAYIAPKGADPTTLAAMGFNLLRVGSAKEEWDACQQAGLMTWFPLDLDFSPDNVAAKEQALKQAVESFKNHPALLFWESNDEPAWSDDVPEKIRVAHEPLIRGYNYLKSLDDSHPVYLNHAPRNTIETLRNYNPAADILCVDVYPVIPPLLKRMYAIIAPNFPAGIARQTDLPDTSPACVGDYVDKMKQVAYPGQPVFVVLQGFSWESLRSAEERDTGLMVTPSYQQLRFMTWQAIVHGVQGITFWGLNYNEQEGYLSDLSAILNEVRDLEAMIVAPRIQDAPTLRYKERGYSIGKGIECRLTQSADTLTLFTVNAAVDPATAIFAALPQVFNGCTGLEVVGENRNIVVSQGSFTDDYDGLGVHIYRWKKQ